jgi:hypothetical protein
MHAILAAGTALAIAGTEVLMAPEELPSALGEAPRDVAAAVARSDDRLEACMRRLGDGTHDHAKYLRAKQIDLNSDVAPEYFVRPVLECNDEFLGAHAISFWLVAGRKGGGLDVVLSDAEDSVALLETRTKGFRDVEVTYSVIVMPLRFNGKHYVGHSL